MADLVGEGALKRWAIDKMGVLLQMPADAIAPIVDHILSFDDAAELKSFLADFTEKSAEHKVNRFVEELFAWRVGPTPAPPRGQQASGRGGGAADRGAGGGGGGGGRGGGKGGDRGGDSPPGGGKGRGRGRGKGREDRAGGAARRGDKDGLVDNWEDREFPGLQMPIYDRPSTDRRRIVIDAASGRYPVLTNCMNCGKVVTEEEGWGPCLFCGNPLEMGDNYGLKRGDERGFIDSAGLLTIEEEKYNASFERAKATKDRLLSYDRDAKKRTKVFDDATDWYSESTNSWLTQQQREDAKRNAAEEERKKKEEKRRIHAKIDLFGRTVISADAEVEAEQNVKRRENFQNWTESVADQNKLLGMMQAEQKGMGGKTSQLSGDSQRLYDQLRASLHATGKELAKSGFKPADEKEGKKSRFYASKNQNEDEFSFVSEDHFTKSAAASNMTTLLPVEESPYGDGDDAGQCLSMHQPWASLLVHGFKRAEGRGWRTEHRGRLWIHAAGKVPEDEEIELLEQTYRSIYEAQGVPMPPLPSQSSGYPTSVLLGCVDLEACFTNKEYMDTLRSNPTLPQEENDNEYIFWCLRPRRLAVPLKMGGDHKIWRLPKMSLAAAQRGLQAVRWPAPREGQAMMSSPSIPEADARRTASAARASASSAPGAAPAPSPGKPAASRSPADAEASAARPPPPRALDLWPAESPEEVLHMVQKDRDGLERDVVVLQNGFVHLAGFIPTDVQQRIVDAMREVGVSAQGFASEQFDGVKASTSVTRMYLGMHWNTMSKTWEAKRSNIDGAPVAELPKMLKDMYDDAIKRANRELTRGPNKKRKLTPFVEGKPPTLGVVNFFAPEGSIQIHQDKQESKASIDGGYAVMGICIGEACEFVYSNEAPGGDKKPKMFRLESGDVYLFGGESRLMWHGVTRILSRTAPPSLRLLPGRLNVTLRVH